MSTPAIVLVPGFWLGGWAWDEVAQDLRTRGHDVTALTLPGLQPDHPDRSCVTMADQVEAITTAIRAQPGPPVVVVHSGAAIPGYGATDVVPEGIAAMVYVDTGPGAVPIDATFAEAEYPMPSWEVLQAQGNSLAGLTEEQLVRFRDRAVPEPGAALREGLRLRNGARRAIPSFVVCTSYRPHEYQAAAAAGQIFDGLTALEDVTYLDLPTGHWPMWSEPQELGEIIDAVARGRNPAGKPGENAATRPAD